MGTRSTIAVQHEDGSVSQIYCHWDGYISHNGMILKTHYTTRGSAEALVKPGDMSSLRDFIHPDADKPHTFDSPQDNVCVYYGRDRGETRVEPKRFDSVEAYKLSVQTEEYDYLFSDGEWTVRRGSGKVWNEFDVVKEAA